MIIKSWMAFAVLIALTGASGAILYRNASAPETAPAIVVSTASTTTEPTPVIPKDTRKAETRAVVPPAKVTTPVQAPAQTYVQPYVDSEAQIAADLAEGLRQLAEDQARAERQRQKELDDWADAIREQNQPIFDCSAKIAEAEKDIRAEIQAAGGTGTNSQIRAMAIQRADC